jgi:hypothetical protein
MVSDIVERLRAGTPSCALELQAADEITRLRDGLERSLGDYFQSQQEIDRLHASGNALMDEILRLRAALAEAEREREGAETDLAQTQEKLHYAAPLRRGKGRPTTATAECISEWRPIETAPKDGTVILVFYPDGFEIDEHVYVWPERFSLSVTPARWHEPNNRAHTEAGWYPPHFWLSFGPWDDASADIDQIEIEPTAPTLIKACEQMLRAAWKAGNEAGEPLDVKKEPLLSGSVREETPHRWGTIRP